MCHLDTVQYFFADVGWQSLAESQDEVASIFAPQISHHER
jgi:hypothetical protein